MKVRAVAISLLVVASLFAVSGAGASMAPPASTASASVDAPSSSALAASGHPDAAGGNNSTSLGSQVSSFMQASAGETSEAVQSGMWDAAYERAGSPGAKSTVVERRLTHLENRLSDLQAEKQALIDALANGSISEQAYQAKMSNLVGRMASLNRTISSVAADASAVGVDSSNVDSLKQTARDIAGPGMSDVAEEMAGGPPDEMPENGKNASNPGNGKGKDGGAKGGNKGGRGNDESDGSDKGEGNDPGDGNGENPGDGGNGDDSGDGGNGDDPGNGNGEGPGSGDNPGGGSGDDPGNSDGGSPGDGNGQSSTGGDESGENGVK